MQIPKRTPVRLGVLYYDRTLPPSWWELVDETTNIRYYWNDVMNVWQYARPSSSPPIQPSSASALKDKCPTCRHSILTCTTFPGQHIHIPQGFQATSSFQPAHLPARLLQFPNNTNALVPHQQDRRVVDAPIQNVTSKVSLGSSSHHMHSTPPTIDTNIFPTKDASLTNFVPLKNLYFSFYFDDGPVKWYCLDVGGGRGSVKDNASEIERIITLLDESSQHKASTLFALNSLIYRILTPVHYHPSAISEVQVLDLKSQEGLCLTSWKEFTPLAKPRAQPWPIFMGGKIYVFGTEFRTQSKPEVKDIAVHTGSELSKWEVLPFPSPPKTFIWSNYFVVPFEDQNKLVIGRGCGKCLYLYDVCTHRLDEIYSNGLISLPWGSKLPPVIVGNMLYLFCSGSLFAYDLVERSHCYGPIDGLDYSFFQANCNKYEDPRLIYLGGGKLCVICLRYRMRESTSIVHCCIFDIPEFIEQGGQKVLRGRLHSVHKFDIDYTEELLNVLLI